MDNLKILDLAFSLGIGIIGYFLRLIHSDLRSLIAQFQKLWTKHELSEVRVEELTRRLEKIEERLL